MKVGFIGRKIERVTIGDRTRRSNGSEQAIGGKALGSAS
jgi:hypothetical protein